MQDKPDRIRVRANDYTYEGYIVSEFKKVGGKERCVVEDDCGRLFIHNFGQIEKLTSRG